MFTHPAKPARQQLTISVEDDEVWLINEAGRRTLLPAPSEATATTGYSPAEIQAARAVAARHRTYVATAGTYPAARRRQLTFA